MHPALRAALALATVCGLLLAAALALGEGPTLPARALDGVVASGSFVSALLVDVWAWLLGRDLLSRDGSPGLLLVAGGMLALLALTVALLLRGALPSEPPTVTAPPRRALVSARPMGMRPPAPVAYRGPRDQEFERGRVAGARIGAPSIDDLLDYMVEAEVGQPRIVRSIPNLMRLRLHECRGCGDAVRQDASAAGVQGCAFECGFLESSLSGLLRSEVIVHEVTCRGRGATTCDFEVWY